jgi:hypothetical protein
MAGKSAALQKFFLCDVPKQNTFCRSLLYEIMFNFVQATAMLSGRQGILFVLMCLRTLAGR